MDPNDKNRPIVYRSAIDFINRADFRPFAIPLKKKKKNKSEKIDLTARVIPVTIKPGWQVVAIHWHIGMSHLIRPVNDY